MNRRAACAAGACAVVCGALLAVSPAWASPSTEVVQGQILRLVSVADWDAASSLLPGEPVQWDVTVSAEASDPGIVAVGVSANGGAALVMDVLRCAQEWDESGCRGGATVLESDRSIPRDGLEVPIVEMADTEVAHLRLVITLDGADSGSTQVRVHARGAGESATVGPDGGLATTGAVPFAHWAIGGALALAAGSAALSASRRRRSAGELGGES